MPSTMVATVGTDEAYYVYGIVPADAAVDDLGDAGMGGPVLLVQHGPVGALVEAVDPERPLGRRRDLVAHSTVLNTMASRGPVLPMRFGSVVQGQDAVRDELLAPQEEHFTALLEQVGGKVQFTLRARYVLDTVLAEIVEDEPEVAELRRRTAGLPEEASHYERIRLGIMSALSVNRTMSFAELKELLRTTDGNLSKHARRLEDANLVEAISRMQQAETAYRAALGALGTTGRLSLMDYLR